MLETPAADVPADAPSRDALLATKLYIPSVRSVEGVVPRPRRSDRLNCRLTSRPILPYGLAGFGKMTLLSEWVVARLAIAPRLGETDQELVRLRKDRAGSP